MSDTTHWNPASLLVDDEKNDFNAKRIAVVVLNQPILNVTIFLKVCNRAHSIIAVDGGANRIHDLHLDSAQQKVCMPQAIIGDMDSLRDDVRSSFASRGVEIHEHVDTESTDFTKALEYLSSTSESITDIAVFGGLGGRADHAFAELNDLYSASVSSSERRIFLLTAESMLFLLEKGKNTIATPRSEHTFGENIGIIPLGRPATIIATKGLEWDVFDYHTWFGTKVSTSNHIRADTVHLDITERMLFTMEFALKLHP